MKDGWTGPHQADCQPRTSTVRGACRSFGVCLCAGPVASRPHGPVLYRIRTRRGRSVDLRFPSLALRDIVGGTRGSVASPARVLHVRLMGMVSGPSQATMSAMGQRRPRGILHAGFDEKRLGRAVNPRRSDA